jgi:hypothetical protein
MQNDLIKEYERIAESIGAYFCNKYFKTDDYDWVAEQKGGVLMVGDYFFSLETMLDYLRYKYGVDKMFEYYDYDLEERRKGEYPICIRDWKKLK